MRVPANVQKHLYMSQNSIKLIMETYFSKIEMKQKHRLTSQNPTKPKSATLFCLKMQRKQKHRLTSQIITFLSTEPYFSKKSFGNTVLRTSTYVPHNRYEGTS